MNQFVFVCQFQKMSYLNFQIQQEQIVMSNMRRSAYFHQQLMYPNVLFPNVAHCLPAPASYEYHNRIINCTGARARADTVGDNSRPLMVERPTHFIEVQEPVYQSSSNDDKSMGNTSTTGQQHVSTIQAMPTAAMIPGIPYPSLPLMPIYRTETDASPFNELFHLHRSQLPHRTTLQTEPFTQKMMAPTQSAFDNQQPIHVKELPSNNQSRFEPIGHYYPNRWGSTFTNPHLISNTLSDGLNHNKYSDLISSRGNYGSVMMPQREISVDNISLGKLEDDSQYSQPNVSARSQSFSSIGYVNQPLPQQQQQQQPQQQHQLQQHQYIQHIGQKPQYSFIEESISQKAVEPIGTSNNLTSHQVIKTLPTFSSYRQKLRNDVVEPPVYDANNICADEIKPRQSISIEKNYDESNNTPSWNKDTFNDEYLHKRELADYNVLPRVESTDSIQSANSPSVTDVDDISTLVKSSPPKDLNEYSYDNGIQQITQSVKSSIPNDETPQEDRYRYDGISDNAYYDKSPSTSTQQVTNTQESRNRFSLPSDDHKKPIKFADKRRSSFDSGSLVKSAVDDSELRKKSIASNVRRRYSVAANLLDLQKNVSNIEPFHLPSLSSINYRADGNTFDTNRNSSDNQPSNTTKSDIVSTFASGQINKWNSMDAGPAVKTEDIVEATQVSDYSDQQIASAANVSNSQQQPVEVVHDNEYGRDVNHGSDINSYYVTDDNAPYSAYETNDETFVETAMENLHLDDSRMERQPNNELQFDDEADKFRVPTTHRYIRFSFHSKLIVIN